MTAAVAAAVPASMVRRVNLGIGFSPWIAVLLSLDALDLIDTRTLTPRSAWWQQRTRRRILHDWVHKIADIAEPALNRAAARCNSRRAPFARSASRSNNRARRAGGGGRTHWRRP